MTALHATERYQANGAPADLAIVQDLANTVGVGPEGDLLSSADEAWRWLTSVTQRTPDVVHETDLTRLHRLRTAIRAVLHGYGSAVEGVDAVVTLRIDHTGVSPQAASDPIDTVASRVAYALVLAQARGQLSRLKLCANPRCQIAFFDESRNGGGRWHAPTRCGNAARVRAHRNRSTPTP